MLSRRLSLYSRRNFTEGSMDHSAARPTTGASRAGSSKAVTRKFGAEKKRIGIPDRQVWRLRGNNATQTGKMSKSKTTDSHIRGRRELFWNIAGPVVICYI